MAKSETIAISKAEYDELLAYKKQVERLQFELAEMKRMIFGSKRERFVPEQDPQQKSLFEIEAQNVKPAEETITYTRKKQQNKEKQQPLRASLPADLPRKQEVIEPEEVHSDAKKIGESISEVLEYKPSQLYVRQIVRPKYAVEETKPKESPIKIAELPGLPIPKSNAGAGLLAHILISKYMDHLPFYRQRKIFKRQELELAESTMNGWFNKSTQLLEHLYGAAKKMLFETDYLMADETPIPVLTKDKPGATHKGYYWVYYAPMLVFVIFDYRKTRARDGPNEMLDNFKGYLQTNAYTAYNNLNNKGNITQLACMAHARRKFEHARDNDPPRAEKALHLFQQLYDIERQARQDNMDNAATKALRQSKAVPILKELKSWMEQERNHVLPKSAIGDAFKYTLDKWSRLERYVEDGRFYIDNNLVENSIRPVALGRKNYLFAGSHNAAQKAAVMYSLLAMCKIADVEPFQWLKSTLEQLPEYSAKDLHKLLPGQK